MVSPRLIAVAAVALCACGSALDITPKSLPNGAQGVPYHQALASTGQQPIRWKIADGSLPSGLELGDSTGIIEGTPLQAGTFPFTVESTENGTFHSNDGIQSFSITIFPKLVPDATIPPAQAGQSYSATVSATGGVPPYTLVVKGLPAHFAFDPQTATISGNPSFAGSYTLELDVIDSGDPQQTAQSNPRLVINPVKVSILTGSLPKAQLGQSYTTTLQSKDGVGPFRWGVVDGVLPAGLDLDPTSGTISGTPNARGNYTFTAEVDDLGNPPDSDSKNLTLTVQ